MGLNKWFGCCASCQHEAHQESVALKVEAQPRGPSPAETTLTTSDLESSSAAASPQSLIFNRSRPAHVIEERISRDVKPAHLRAPSHSNASGGAAASFHGRIDLKHLLDEDSGSEDDEMVMT